MKQYKSHIPELVLTKRQTDYKKVKITSSKDAADYIRNFYSDDISIYESAFILLLNQANYTIGWAKIGQGGISGTVVDIRLILKYAVESLATAVILAHNHPSGNLKESEQDKRLTRKTKESLQLMDIQLFDHLILTEENYLSFADEGIL